MTAISWIDLGLSITSFGHLGVESKGVNSIGVNGENTVCVTSYILKKLTLVLDLESASVFDQ